MLIFRNNSKEKLIQVRTKFQFKYLHSTMFTISKEWAHNTQIPQLFDHQRINFHSLLLDSQWRKCACVYYLSSCRATHNANNNLQRATLIFSFVLNRTRIEIKHRTSRISCPAPPRRRLPPVLVSGTKPPGTENAPQQLRASGATSQCPMTGLPNVYPRLQAYFLFDFKQPLQHTLDTTTVLSVY